MLKPMGIFGGNPVPPTSKVSKGHESGSGDRGLHENGRMNVREFRHDFKRRLHENTGLSRTEAERAHALAEGFMDKNETGIFQHRSMDSKEGGEYLKALNEAGFTGHQIGQIREAMTKDFD